MVSRSGINLLLQILKDSRPGPENASSLSVEIILIHPHPIPSHLLPHPEPLWQGWVNLVKHLPDLRGTAVKHILVLSRGLGLL